MCALKHSIPLCYNYTGLYLSAYICIQINECIIFTIKNQHTFYICTLCAIVTSPSRTTYACFWCHAISTIEATIRANSFYYKINIINVAIYKQFYIRVLHVLPLQPSAQLHFPGEIHLPPLKQPSGQYAKINKQLLMYIYQNTIYH